MINHWYSITLVLMLFISPFSGFAQVPATPTVNLIVQPVGASTYDPIRDTFPPFANDTAQISLVLKVQDTTNISTISVALGTTSGGSDLLQKTFTFDGAASMPDGTTYQRIGYGVYLGLGKFYGFNRAYSSVSLVNTSGASGSVNSSFP